MTDTSKQAVAAVVERLGTRAGIGSAIDATHPRSHLVYALIDEAASLISALEAERDALRAQVALANDPAYLATAIDKVGMVDKEWKARAEAAEALNAALEAKLEKAAETLEWYGEQARLARLMHSGGDAGRHALQDDGGKRARSTLSTLRETTDDQT